METEDWLDATDTIRETSGAWDDFARVNGGELLLRQHVVGTPLFDYVVGDATRMFVRVLFQLARERRDAVRRTYRCDSPELRRCMEMIVTPQSQCAIRVQPVLMCTEPIAPNHLCVLP